MKTIIFTPQGAIDQKNSVDFKYPALIIRL